MTLPLNYPLLTVDTSQSKLCLGLFGDTGLLAECEVFIESQRSHSSLLIPELQTLLGQAGLSLAAIQSVAVCVGPGSFTGIRAGVCTVRGFLQAFPQWQVFTVSSLDLLVEQALNEVPFPSRLSLNALENESLTTFSLGIALHAGRGLAYLGIATVQPLLNQWQWQTPPTWTPLDTIPHADDWVVSDRLKDHPCFQHKTRLFSLESLLSSRNQALHHRLQTLPFLEPATLDTLVPLYLQPPNITPGVLPTPLGRLPD